jgi:hypothetical protein
VVAVIQSAGLLNAMIDIILLIKMGVFYLQTEYQIAGVSYYYTKTSGAR